VADQPGFLAREPPAPKARDIKIKLPEEAIRWKHSSRMLIAIDIRADSLETRCRAGGKGLIAPMHLIYKWGLELSKVIRVRYEKGVLKPLEPVELREGEEIVVFILRRRVGEVLKKYVGMFGRADIEELRKYEEEEAQAQ